MLEVLRVAAFALLSRSELTRHLCHNTPDAPAGGCTIKKMATAVVVGIYGEGVPHGEPLLLAGGHPVLLLPLWCWWLCLHCPRATVLPVWCWLYCGLQCDASASQCYTAAPAVAGASGTPPPACGLVSHPPACLWQVLPPLSCLFLWVLPALMPGPALQATATLLWRTWETI